MIHETKSNWANVAGMVKTNKHIKLGRYASYWIYNTPRRLLYSLSYYKFASKLVGQNKKVLDVGCNEGLGTWLLSKECGNATGIDFDEGAISAAHRNFNGPNLSFECVDFLNFNSTNKWDAITSFDVIEHIYPENVSNFYQKAKECLTPHSIAIFGTPSEISQSFASEISKRGHVNIYTPDRLVKELEMHFKYVFLFSANDEVVHTGFSSLAHYFIAVACIKK